MTRLSNIITGEPTALEDLLVIKNFPVYMGCTDDVQENDVKQDFILQICPKTGVIQLKNPLPYELAYKFPHNDAVGNIWKDHVVEFSKFISKFGCRNFLEIGGGSGKLAEFYTSITNQYVNWTILDKNYCGSTTSRISVINEWIENYKNSLSHYDGIVHSHVLEHFYNPVECLKNIRQKMAYGTTHIFSVPNLYEWMRNKYSNCLNFEHTIFLTEEVIDWCLHRTGFKILEKQKFNTHSIFYACTTSNKSSGTILKNRYKHNKQLIKEFELFTKHTVQSINDSISDFKGDVYLFGSHIFSQFLLYNGLNMTKIKGIIDNSKMKNGKRLYGTPFVSEFPSILRDKNDVMVVVRAGEYTDEIKNDIISNINPKVQFI